MYDGHGALGHGLPEYGGSRLMLNCSEEVMPLNRADITDTEEYVGLEKQGKGWALTYMDHGLMYGRGDITQDTLWKMRKRVKHGMAALINSMHSAVATLTHGFLKPGEDEIEKFCHSSTEVSVQALYSMNALEEKFSDFDEIEVAVELMIAVKCDRDEWEKLEATFTRSGTFEEYVQQLKDQGLRPQVADKFARSVVRFKILDDGEFTHSADGHGRVDDGNVERHMSFVVTCDELSAAKFTLPSTKAARTHVVTARGGAAPKPSVQRRAGARSERGSFAAITSASAVKSSAGGKKARPVPAPRNQLAEVITLGDDGNAPTHVVNAIKTLQDYLITNGGDQQKVQAYLKMLDELKDFSSVRVEDTKYGGDFELVPAKIVSLPEGKFGLEVKIDLLKNPAKMCAFGSDNLRLRAVNAGAGIFRALADDAKVPLSLTNDKLVSKASASNRELSHQVNFGAVAPDKNQALASFLADKIKKVVVMSYSIEVGRSYVVIHVACPVVNGMKEGKKIEAIYIGPELCKEVGVPEGFTPIVEGGSIFTTTTGGFINSSIIEDHGTSGWSEVGGGGQTISYGKVIVTVAQVGTKWPTLPYEETHFEMMYTQIITTNFFSTVEGVKFAESEVRAASLSSMSPRMVTVAEDVTMNSERTSKSITRGKLVNGDQLAVTVGLTAAVINSSTEGGSIGGKISSALTAWHHEHVDLKVSNTCELSAKYTHFVRIKFTKKVYGFKQIATGLAVHADAFIDPGDFVVAASEGVNMEACRVYGEAKMIRGSALERATLGGEGLTQWYGDIIAAKVVTNFPDVKLAEDIHRIIESLMCLEDLDTLIQDDSVLRGAVLKVTGPRDEDASTRAPPPSPRLPREQSPHRPRLPATAETPGLDSKANFEVSLYHHLAGVETLGADVTVTTDVERTQRIQDIHSCMMNESDEQKEIWGGKDAETTERATEIDMAIAMDNICGHWSVEMLKSAYDGLLVGAGDFVITKISREVAADGLLNDDSRVKILQAATESFASPRSRPAARPRQGTKY
jgi:hypothetical protein